jgi:hypothetical protein
MSLLQISRSPDLLRLQQVGYNIEVTRGGFLVIRDVPYVNAAKEIRRGALVSNLDLAGDQTKQPEDHKMMFIGDFPCHADGQPMEMLRLNSTPTTLEEGLEIQHTFSRKPVGRQYRDYYEKVEAYLALIAREATAIDPLISALTRQVIEPDDTDYPFQYLDTASARAEINVVARKLATEKVAIIGLGGTGSYVLDLVAKAPVRAIHLFDGDKLSTHNAFRVPGAASIEELREHPKKTNYFEKQYSRISRRITAHEEHIDSSNADLLRECTFAFVCIDRGPARRFVVEKLEEFDIPFIDVGMGLYRHGDTLGGQLRVTMSVPGHRESARASIPFGGTDKDAEYDKDIQVADLNALNASLAVIRWKRYRGFYSDSEREQLSTYTVAFNLLSSEDQIHETTA